MALPSPAHTDDVVHAPYIPAAEAPAELTPGVIILGIVLGVMFAPISTSGTMFMGGALRWIVDRRLTTEERDGPRADSGPGVLFASGLIAGGAITGVVLAALQAKGLDAAIDMSKSLGSSSVLLSMIAYIALLAIPVYAVARARRSP